jgi:hypothetical protein
MDHWRLWIVWIKLMLKIIFFDMHMTSLRKQGVVWKPFNWNLFTWAFYNVKNNQTIGLTQNLVMQCIISHNKMVGLEILTLHTRY